MKREGNHSNTKGRSRAALCVLVLLVLSQTGAWNPRLVSVDLVSVDLVSVDIVSVNLVSVELVSVDLVSVDLVYLASTSLCWSTDDTQNPPQLHTLTGSDQLYSS